MSLQPCTVFVSVDVLRPLGLLLVSRELEVGVLLEYHWSKGPTHFLAPAMLCIRHSLMGAFLACIPILLTDRFVGTSIQKFRTPHPQPGSRNVRPSNPPLSNCHTHVLETFRKLLHTPHAPFTRQEGAFWKRALGRGRRLVCNPGCFSLAASAARARTAVSTYHMVQDHSRTLPLQWNADRLGCRYCWETNSTPSKELIMTKTSSKLNCTGLLERKLKSSSRYLSDISVAMRPPTRPEPWLVLPCAESSVGISQGIIS